ncbi:hypothetical protein OK016_25410 [Vibrio chagasii]|nr:hypothetical protein [Vibrio chagasii]
MGAVLLCLIWLRKEDPTNASNIDKGMYLAGVEFMAKHCANSEALPITNGDKSERSIY